MPEKIRRPDDIARTLYIHSSNHNRTQHIGLVDRKFILAEYQRLYQIIETAANVYKDAKHDNNENEWYWERLGEVLNAK